MTRLPAQTVETMIAARVRAGYREDESRTILRRVTTAHDGDNLVHALVIERFATQARAERYVRSTRVVTRNGRLGVTFGTR